MVFLAVQTVFEGFGSNTAAKAKAACDDHDLPIPVGQDAGPSGAGSVTMRRYRSGGTPWTVIIDRGGVVRSNGFRAPADASIRLIDRLLAEPVDGRLLQSLPKTERRGVGPAAP